MIYLIDDNQNDQRRSNYNITFTDDNTFEGYLTTITQLKKSNDFADISHLEFLKNADCILIHSTTEDFDEKKGFVSGSTSNVLKIKELISKYGEKIPLVLFSNSMSRTEYVFENNPNYISAIKKNLLYENLLEFLKHYKSTGIVDLRIIVGGKRFVRKTITNLALEIMHSIELKNDSADLKLYDLSEMLPSIKFFFELSYPEKNVSEIFDDLEDNSMKIKDFKNKIKKITESFTKYGQNIYPW